MQHPKDGNTPKPAGQKRSDLPGYMKARGNKIYVRYKGKDLASGFHNTSNGWNLANKWWENKVKELQDIEDGALEMRDTFANIFQKFIAHKKKFQKLQERTLKDYQWFFNSIFKHSDPDLIMNEDNIKIVLENLLANSGGNSATTINDKLKVLKTFFIWASDEDRRYIARKDYTKKYKQSESHSVRESYTPDEYKAFVDYFMNKGGKNDVEMAYLLRFLWETGARSSETLAIKINDINWPDNYIKIPNKMHKEQSEALLFSDETKLLLKDIVALSKVRGDGKLFGWKDRALPARKLRRAEVKLNLRVQNRGLHGFRRSFADRLFLNNFDMTAVKEIMRHRDISTILQHYKSYNRGKLVEEMNRKLSSKEADSSQKTSI